MKPPLCIVIFQHKQRGGRHLLSAFDISATAAGGLYHDKTVRQAKPNPPRIKSQADCELHYYTTAAWPENGQGNNEAVTHHNLMGARARTIVRERVHRHLVLPVITSLTCPAVDRSWRCASIRCGNSRAGAIVRYRLVELR